MGDPDQLRNAVLKSPNDHIHVTKKGVYEIVEVTSLPYKRGYLVHVVCLI